MAKTLKISNERLCEYCEEHVIGCKGSSSTFICEGGWCEEAKKSMIDVLENDPYTEYDEIEFEE